MNREQELELRLAESQHTEAELRRVVDILLAQGDAVFASRSWRLGRGLLAPLETLLRRLGRGGGVAQDTQHWRGIAAAHDDALARRRVLLQALCDDADGARDLDPLLAELWRQVAQENAVSDDASRDASPINPA